MLILLVEATLTKFNRVKDGAITLNFKTMREMSNDGLALVDKYFQKNGHLAFKLDEVEITDLPTENTQIKGQKSRSQLLRQKILALHFKKGGNRDDFTPVYESWMNKFEQEVQDELDQLED
jgi:hypothetical protein